MVEGWDGHPYHTYPPFFKRISFHFFAERHKIVRNARTQTSPQESVLSEESPLQTPLPRKQPPMPMSRFDLPRSRPYSHRPRSDVLRIREQKERVYFDQPDISSAEPTYIREFTDKGEFQKYQIPKLKSS